MSFRSIRRLLICLVILIVVAGGYVLDRVSERVLRPPRRGIEERLVRIIEDPARHGMEIDRFSVSAPDGIEISAMHVSPTAVPGEAPRGRRLRALIGPGKLANWGNSRGTVFLLHGRGGRMEFLLPVVERFVAGGFNCVLYSARGHGDSGGEYITYGKREVEDLQAVIEQVRRRYALGENAYLWGLSLGGAVSMMALPELEGIRGAIVVAAFEDLRTQGRHSIVRSRCPDSVAGVLVNSLAVVVQAKADFTVNEIRPVASASRVTVPTMVVHGELDKVIPVEAGRRLFEAIPETTEKIWRSVPDAYHGNVLARGGDRLYAEMVEFFLDQLIDEDLGPRF